MMARLSSLVLAFFCLLAGPWVAAETPLFQEGKSSLYERVLSRGTLERREAPGAEGSGVAARALSPFYVFERTEQDGESWIRIAPGEDGANAFWARESDTTPWRQTIVLKFTTLGDFDRLLIFDDIDSVYDVVESEDPAYDAGTLRTDAVDAVAAGTSGEGPIVALGPELGVDLAENFYMLPILEAEEAVFETGGFVNLVKVAVAKASGDESEGNSDASGADTPSRQEVLRDFSAGVVFVVDTTRSMGRYFGPVREAVSGIYDTLSNSEAATRLSFGLVGFRDAETRKGVEYRRRIFAPMAPVSERAVFFEGLDRMREATATTKGFNEDSFSGVKHALDEIDWTGIDARFLVLITDAGPRLSNDELSETRLSARGLANYAKNIRGAHVAVLHLKTPAGANTHAFAEAQYAELSRAGPSDPLYFEVPRGDEAALRSVTERLAQAIAGAVVQAADGRELDVDAYEADDDATEAETEMTRRALRVMRSMQLDFLGAETSAEAPDVFEGWIADRDFRNQGVRPVEVRLLVTRRQLSDLDEALRLIVEKGEESGLEPANFFRRVLGAAAEMSRRPDAVSTTATEGSLADAALISEMLEGLPYRSKVMSIDESDWLKMSIGEQQEFLDLLIEKLERYRQGMSGVDNWVLLNEAQTADDAVYPMPLEDLP